MFSPATKIKATEMLERRKSFNSSLHNISKKRLAEIQAGTYKPKRSAIARTSKKSASLWAKARRECLATYGHRCFICGRSDLPIHIHHWKFTRTQRPDLKYDQDNLIPLCELCHNHSGPNKRFYELQTLIKNKKDAK